MEYSIQELSRLSGVTTRTLRWYDQIGLLKPSRVAESGYRYYGRAEVDRLQDILYYRALGVELARKYKESENIIHAIEAHHNDVEPRTIVACLVQAADAVSAARPGARRENLENYIKRLEKLEEITSSYPGVEKSYAIQAGREVRVMVKPEQVSEDQMVILARELAHRIENELEYPGQIKVHVLRETKAVEYAK